MVVPALLVLFFMIGYLSYMKLSDQKDYKIPPLHFEIYFVLYQHNNTFIPSTFFNLKEENSEETIKSGTSSESSDEIYDNPLFKSKVTSTIYINPYGAASEVTKPDYENSESDTDSENKNFEDKIENNVVFDDTCKAILEINTSLITYENSIENRTQNFDNNSIILYENTTVILKVNDKIQNSTDKFLTNEINLTVKNESFLNGEDCSENTSISTEFLNGWFVKDRYFMKQSRTNKIPNGIYIAINPCMYKHFEIVRVIGYKFVTESKNSLSNIIELVNTKNINDKYIPWNQLSENLQTAMAVYYGDMSVLDYTLNDIIKRSFYPNFWLMCIIAVLILLIYSKPLRLYNRSRKSISRRTSSTFVNFQNDDDQFQASKSDILNLVLEMKEIQNESLVKMELVFNQTNSKLHYMLQKLALVEDFIISSKMKETQEVMKSVIEFTKSNNKQIKALKLEQDVKDNIIHSLSLNLDKTQSDMEELKSNYKTISENQKSIIKEMGELKTNINSSKMIDPKKDIKSNDDRIEPDKRLVEENFQVGKLELPNDHLDTCTTLDLQHSQNHGISSSTQAKDIAFFSANNTDKKNSSTGTAFIVQFNKEKSFPSVQSDVKCNKKIWDTEDLKTKEMSQSLINVSQNSDTEVKTKPTFSESKTVLLEDLKGNLLPNSKRDICEFKNEIKQKLESVQTEKKTENNIRDNYKLSLARKRKEQMKGSDDKETFSYLENRIKAKRGGRTVVLPSQINENQVTDFQTEENIKKYQKNVHDKSELFNTQLPGFYSFASNVPMKSKEKEQPKEQHQEVIYDFESKEKPHTISTTCIKNNKISGDLKKYSDFQSKHQEHLQNNVKTDSDTNEAMQVSSTLTCIAESTSEKDSFKSEEHDSMKIFPEIKLLFKPIDYTKQFNVGEVNQHQCNENKVNKEIKENLSSAESIKTTQDQSPKSNVLKTILQQHEDNYRTRNKLAHAQSHEIVKANNEESLAKESNKELNQIPLSVDKLRFLEDLLPNNELLKNLQTQPVSIDKNRTFKRSRIDEKVKIRKDLSITSERAILKDQPPSNKRLKITSCSDGTKQITARPLWNKKLKSTYERSPIEKRKIEIKVHSSGLEMTTINKEQHPNNENFKIIQKQQKSNERMKGKIERFYCNETLKITQEQSLSKETDLKVAHPPRTEKVQKVTNQIINERSKTTQHRPKSNETVSRPQSNEDKNRKLQTPNIEKSMTTKEYCSNTEKWKMTREQTHNNESLKTILERQKSIEKIKEIKNQPKGNVGTITLSDFSSIKVGKQKKERSLSAERTKILNERPKSIEKSKSLKEQAIRREKEQTMNLLATNNLKNKPTNTVESPKSRNLEANPLFKKQMSQNLSNIKKSV